MNGKILQREGAIVKVKKVIAVFLAAALLLAMAACGDNSGNSGSQPEKSSSTAVSAVNGGSSAATESTGETGADPLSPYGEAITVNFGADMAEIGRAHV